MYQAQQKSNNTSAMLMFASVINHALELDEKQAEQDAQIIKQSERYAEEHGMDFWQGNNW
jgi:hypothetical protein